MGRMEELVGVVHSDISCFQLQPKVYFLPRSLARHTVAGGGSCHQYNEHTIGRISSRNCCS